MNNVGDELTGYSQTASKIEQPVPAIWLCAIYGGLPSTNTSITSISRLNLFFLLFRIFFFFLLFLFLLLVVLLLLFIFVLFPVIIVELTLVFRWFPAVRQSWCPIGLRRMVGDFILMSDNSAVLIEFYAAGKWTRSGWRRYSATGGDITLLVIRVLF